MYWHSTVLPVLPLNFCMAGRRKRLSCSLRSGSARRVVKLSAPGGIKRYNSVLLYPRPPVFEMLKNYPMAPFAIRLQSNLARPALSAAFPVGLRHPGFGFVVLPIGRAAPLQEITFPIHLPPLAIRKTVRCADPAG